MKIHGQILRQGRIDLQDVGNGFLLKPQRKIFFVQPQAAPECVDKGQIGSFAAVGLAASLQDRDLVSVEAVPEFIQQAAFSQPCFSNDGHKLAVSGRRLIKAGIQRSQFSLPAGKLGEALSVWRPQSGFERSILPGPGRAQSAARRL